jgi:NAD(P)H-hydrate epimerase
MKVLSTAQIRQLDAYTIAHEPITPINLMERAALRCVNWLRMHYNLNSQTLKFSVVCGPGNNGGDGLVIARHLHQMGQQVNVYLIQDGKNPSPDNHSNHKRLIKAGLVPSESLNLQPSIVIDAIFGSGFADTATGVFADAINHINQSGLQVISIDTPSGLSGDVLGKPESHVVQATHTLTFHCPKRTFMFPQTGSFVGSWHVLDISLSTQHEAELPTNEYLISPALLAPILQPRTAQFAHKGTYGHALIAAGSMGKLGAADLAARAALAAGAGLVTLHCPGGSTSTRAEIMTQADDNAQYITDIPLHNWDAIGFGPGVGTHQDTARALKLLLQNWKNGLVIDADGLNILSENPTWLSFLPQNTVLTPHPKEFSRLAGIITNDTELYAKATEFAQKYQVVLVLKGRHTMVCAPGGNIWFNPTGNPGMATAGMGDVLTGMITAYLANGLSPLYAALKAVFLHGLSGDRAMTEPHANHITAGDLVNHIGSNKL